MSSEVEGSSRLLVLCVDRDDDLGTKTGIKTPLVGRNNCVEAAQRLALADPEEADANTMFASIRQHDELVRKGYDCEVAVVSGVYERGVEADRKVRAEVTKVLRSYDADGAILVTDGAEDEQVIPIIQGLIPIVSVSRVVIKHSKSMEESYMIFARYLRMLAFDPRYSRWVLGVPGLLMLTFVVLSYFNLVREAFIITLGIVGIVLLLRGFSLDKAIGQLATIRPSGYLRVFSAIASFLLIAGALFQAYGALSRDPRSSAILLRPEIFFNPESAGYLAGLFIRETLNPLWAGLAVYFTGGLLVHHLRGSIKKIKDAVTLVLLGFVYMVILAFSLVLQGGSLFPLMLAIVAGLAGTFITALLAYRHIRSARESRSAV